LSKRQNTGSSLPIGKRALGYRVLKDNLKPSEKKAIATAKQHFSFCFCFCYVFGCFVTFVKSLMKNPPKFFINFGCVSFLTVVFVYPSR
jgi:hypothetical protein